MPACQPVFDLQRSLTLGGRQYSYQSLRALEHAGYPALNRLPACLKVLLENVLRAHALGQASFDDVLALAGWQPRARVRSVVPFRPTRVLMQDSTGLPALVDLAALRDAVAETGGDAAAVKPRVPVDLVVDHSVIVEHFGRPDALQRNMEGEFARNAERYRFLRWAQQAFENLRIVPPGGGICHQVNLEYLASVVTIASATGQGLQIYPDSLVGTDSHTTMVNALGILAWGVGGVEAEAVMLGRPLEVAVPEVVGVRLRGRPGEGVAATDLVLMLTERLRREGVVGSFVEFTGDGLDALSLADRATLANMAPEYGATCAFFPVDGETLRYLAATGRERDQVALVAAYAKAQGWWRHSDDRGPVFSREVDLDLGTVRPCLAGPRRPEQRVDLSDLREHVTQALATAGRWERRYAVEGGSFAIGDGSVVVAAITSCTNTSNPAAMIAAGLLARKAVKRGLTVKPWIMTSLAPGSAAVSDYLIRLGLQGDLDRLGFNVVAYGCGACVGNTAPLAPSLAAVIEANDLDVAAVLSGNRNFEGRINPLVKSSYLASPALVVAYALAGSLLIDLTRDPLGIDEDAEPVYLRDIWPSKVMIEAAMSDVITPELYRRRAMHLFQGSAAWQALPGSGGLTYAWDEASSYVRRPPFLARQAAPSPGPQLLAGARVLLLLGDGVTTDHISPAGPVGRQGTAADYLRDRGVGISDFNTYGARRGNHEVMTRGAFTNAHLRNALVPDRRGGFTRHFPDGRVMPVFEAAARYRQSDTPLVVVAGKDYGGGSSRDWAAKGTALLGVKAVIAESFERIHRANLIAVGILPLQFMEGASWQLLGLDGSERFSLGVDGALAPRGTVMLSIDGGPASPQQVALLCRIDTAGELAVLRAGGLLPLLLQELVASSRESGGGLTSSSPLLSVASLPATAHPPVVRSKA